MALTPEQRQSYGEHYIYQAFEELLGRQPTKNETAQFFPSLGTDRNIHDIASMKARVAEYAAQEKEKAKPEEDKKKREEEAKTYHEGIAKLVKNTLGRDGTPEEIDHFARLKTQGFDDYELKQALEMLPEYAEKQDLTAREKLRGELSSADTAFYNQSVLPTIQSRMAQQGRSIEGSGFASALANAAKDINVERERYLAGVGHEDYVNRRQQSINSYLGNLQAQQQENLYNRTRSDQVSDVYRQRGFDLTDYDMQMRAYQDYLKNAGKRQKKGGLFGGAGGLVGMGIGAALAAPTGGMSLAAGAALGGGLGGGFGSLFDE